MSKTNQWNRRSFLRALGIGSAATAAAMRFMPVTQALAQTQGTPKRLILFTSADGVILRNWRPSGGETNFTLGSTLQPLQPHRDSLLIVDGVDMDYGVNPRLGHAGMAALFSGRGIDANLQATGPTVDQFIADSISANTPFRSLQIAAGHAVNDQRGLAYWRAAGQPLPVVNNPRTVFDTVYANVTDGTPDPAADRRRAERRSVLDNVSGDLSTLQSRLPASDRARFEAHLEAVRGLEQRLSAAVVECSKPAQPAAYSNADLKTDALLPDLTELQLDMMTQALACDLTRVIGFSWGREGSTGQCTWLGHNTGIHTLSHDNTDAGVALMSQYNRWVAEQLASLISKLKAVPEGDGTLFDNTLIMWVTPISQGYTHSQRNLPIVLAGGKNCYFRTGRYLKFGSYSGLQPPYHDPHGGERMSKVLVSLCHAMGLTSVSQFGDPSLGSGALEELL